MIMNMARDIPAEATAAEVINSYQKINGVLQKYATPRFGYLFYFNILSATLQFLITMDKWWVAVSTPTLHHCLAMCRLFAPP